MASESRVLGPPRNATTAAGDILWQEHYDPYGSKLNMVAEKIGYTGHAHDPESGYTHLQARFYDPLVGRCLSTDPIHFQDSDPFTFNRYAYANNNPYKYVDPLGQESACVTVDGCKTFAVSPSPKVINTVADFTPVVSDIKGIAEAIADPSAINIIAASVGLVPGVRDAIAKGLKTGANIAENAARGTIPTILRNKAAGDAFRDELAASLQQAGREVSTEVYKRTPFGRRFIDIEVSRDGTVHGGIETKVGASKYTPLQQLKDRWLKNIEGYPVNVARSP